MYHGKLKEPPNLALYLVRRTKIVAWVLTLSVSVNIEHGFFAFDRRGPRRDILTLCIELLRQLAITGYFQFLTRFVGH